MRLALDRTSLLTNTLLFHGLLAAPLAWTAQLVVGYGLGEADCSAGGMQWGIDSEAGEIVLTAATGAWALSGLATAAWLWREERRQRVDDRGRVEFMAAGGVLVSTIFLALILLGGIASLFIAHCRQA